jgi:Domain of unknown function (DUF4279)
MIIGLPEHKNQICIYLSIFGNNFNPEDLTAKINIQPTHTHRKGDIIPRPKSLYVKPGSPPLRRKEDAWRYDLGYIHTIDSDEISDIIEKTFRDKVSDISEFIKTYNLLVKLFVVLNIDPEQTPAVGFKPSFVKILGDLYAEIDMDIYVIKS